MRCCSGAGCHGCAEHADLHGIDPDVVQHGRDLRLDDLRWDGVDGRDGLRILCRDRRDGGRAIDAEGGKRLQIRLDSSATPAVGAGNRQGRSNSQFASSVPGKER